MSETPRAESRPEGASRTCARCGAPLPSDADPSQACARCLLRVALEASAASGQRVPAPGLAELQPHFPRLELLALVGEGGMGAVYKARDRELDRIVALKVLTVRDEDGAPEHFDERFAREARAMARLAHPNIAAVHDHGKAGPWSYLVLEYVDGENLRRVMRTRAVKPSEALRWVGEICSALQYAHENGVIHRDIKPENVLVDSKGRVKVVDFGLAKLIDRRPGEATLTASRQSLGTWHYMAPEQYERPQVVDHRADIYSLGVVLYELLTGQVPVGRFDLPSQRVELDVRIDEVVLKALAREPEKRYQAASEVKSRVDDIGRGAPAAASAVREARPRSAGKLVAIVIGVVLAIGLVPIGLLFLALFVGLPEVPPEPVVAPYDPFGGPGAISVRPDGGVRLALLGIPSLLMLLASAALAALPLLLPRPAGSPPLTRGRKALLALLPAGVLVLGGIALLVAVRLARNMQARGSFDPGSPESTVVQILTAVVLLAALLGAAIGAVYLVLRLGTWFRTRGIDPLGLARSGGSAPRT